MKNPLYYVDYWYDLIKFGFDRKHTFITLIVVCVSFIAPILLLIAYQSAPSRKNIEDPFVFVGTISEFHKYDSYRGGTGCNISVRGSGKIFDLHIGNRKTDYEQFGMQFCDLIYKNYIDQICVKIKMSERFLNEYGYCDGTKIHTSNAEDWDNLYFQRNILTLTSILLFLSALYSIFKLHKEYKKSKLKD